MPTVDIKKVRLPDGSVHNVQDATARAELDNKADKNNPVFTGSISMGRYLDSTVGNGSVAEGLSVTASGNYSHAEGSTTTASGTTSHAEGSLSTASGVTSHAEGASTTASGNYSHAEGAFTVASGQNSHAEGYYTTVSGKNAHVEGASTIAAGDESHVFGKYNIADSFNNIQEWVSGTSYAVNDVVKITNGTTITKYICKTSNSDTTFSSSKWLNCGQEMVYIEIVGNGTYSNRTNARTLDWQGNEVISNSITIGYRNTTNGIGAGSFASGNYVSASGAQSHAEGGGTIASGAQSHAEGSGTTASGSTAHAEGGGSRATGSCAHAEGSGTTASGSTAHAEGGGTTASGEQAHAEGASTVASGNYSHAEGYGTIANHAYQHVFGQFNEADPSTAAATARGNYVEIVGNGSSTNVRSNLRTLNWDGTERLAGNLYVRTNGHEGFGYEVLASDKLGGANGIATLDSSGKVPSSQLPSYVDDVLEYADVSSFPGTGESGKIYVALDTNSTYRWSGSTYIELTTEIDLSSKADKNNPVFTGSISLARKDNTTVGSGSVAVGYENEASGNYSTAFGDNNTASGQYAYAEGRGNTASGTASHAEGRQTTASGVYTHSEGYNTTASNEYAHSEGYGTIASGAQSHAEGNQTIAVGASQHTFGDFNVSDELDEWAEDTEYKVGDVIKLTQSYGNTTWVTNYICTQENNDHEFNYAHWDSINGKTRFVEIVGNGLNNSNRSNARTLDWNGNERLAGDLYVHANQNGSGGSKVLSTSDISIATEEETREIIADYNRRKEEDEGMVVETTFNVDPNDAYNVYYETTTTASDIATAFKTGKHVVVHLTYEEGEGKPSAYGIHSDMYAQLCGLQDGYTDLGDNPINSGFYFSNDRGSGAMTPPPSTCATDLGQMFSYVSVVDNKIRFAILID